MPRSVLAELMRLYRAVNNLSFRQLAAEIGTSPSTLCRFEQGHAIDLATWIRIQSWLINGTPRKAGG